MPNPNPKQTPEFLARQKPKIGDKALCKPIPVRFEEHIDALLRSREDKQALIRRYVEEGLRRENLLE